MAEKCGLVVQDKYGPVIHLAGRGPCHSQVYTYTQHPAISIVSERWAFLKLLYVFISLYLNGNNSLPYGSMEQWELVVIGCNRFWNWNRNWNTHFHCYEGSLLYVSISPSLLSSSVVLSWLYSPYTVLTLFILEGVCYTLIASLFLLIKLGLWALLWTRGN